MKKIALYVAAIAMMSMTAISCSSSAKNESNTESDKASQEVAAEVSSPAEADAVITLENDEQFRPDKKVATLTVLDFNAVWCVPCKKLTPAFEEAAKTFAGKVDFYSVDIDKCPDTKEAFDVKSVPTVVFLTPDGKVESFVGLGPFVQDKISENSTPEETTKIILDNLTEMIQKAL